MTRKIVMIPDDFDNVLARSVFADQHQLIGTSSDRKELKELIDKAYEEPLSIDQARK